MVVTALTGNSPYRAPANANGEMVIRVPDASGVLHHGTARVILTAVEKEATGEPPRCHRVWPCNKRTFRTKSARFVAPIFSMTQAR